MPIFSSRFDSLSTDPFNHRLGPEVRILRECLQTGLNDH